MTKPTIIISYSNSDEDIIWKERLVPQLKTLENIGRIALWDDGIIERDGKWFNEIKPIIDQAAVTVCLISPDYLASKLCYMEEIPYLLEIHEKKGMSIIPVLLRPCQWFIIPWLEKIKVIPGDYSPDKKDYKYVSIDFENKWDKVFMEVAEEILKKIKNPEYRPPKPTPRFSPPEKIDITRFPMTGEELFGRQKELEMLDNAWKSDDTHVLSFVAWGGVGKSTLVNKWLERMEAENYRGARMVFAWSFHSQGTGEKVTSADLFFSEALAWFGDPDPTEGSAWDKGARLAELVRTEKNLLVLDGLEPLQSSYEYERGKIKDPGMATLLSELARNNNGLCIITTREGIADLSLYPETTCRRDLEQVSAEAGRALLRISGVQGTDAELEAATRDFGNHALALTLLGVYLRDITGHHISQASDIPDLDIPDKKGRHPRRLMTAFEKRFGEGPEVELLSMLGLFDHPADGGTIAALRAPLPITGLTEHINELSEADWLHLVSTLRENRLIAPKSRYEPDTLDAHPLLREHFGEQLRESRPEAWREAHSRLYEHYKSRAEESPDTIEEMVPLYRGVAHGCQAGRYEEAFKDVYRKRIQRSNEYFGLYKLGAFGADLAALSGFFDSPFETPVVDLNVAEKSLILSIAGFDLRALGRLAEAAQPMKASLEAAIAQEDWKNAAIRANNLSELSLTTGNLPQALEYAEQSVGLADRSDDAFERMSDRATLADALHQAGRLSEAEAAFLEAEKMQKEQQPEYPLLYSLRGFRYCDLLLGQGKYQEVLNQGEQTIEWEEGRLLDIALDHLSLGRAHLLQALQEGTDDFTLAAEHLNQAVDGLRKSGYQYNIPLGLLSRAKLYRVQAAIDKVRRDLDEAMTIAERGEMGLHQADCHLEYARLYLAIEEKEKTREHLATAKEMIQKMGYHRRDGEVEELEAML